MLIWLSLVLASIFSIWPGFLITIRAPRLSCRNLRAGSASYQAEWAQPRAHGTKTLCFPAPECRPP
ncbi:MAG TPA: hypothetical protein VE684_19665, partial [Crenalkalicoccus sp.]|nr:hypothetical protein [Crenalkalicoccus sp.]